MPATFSASTCISSNNTSPGPFNIYLDSNYTSTPFSSATLTQLTSCPFVIVVPTGTTSLGFKDTLLDFCFETTIQDNNICSNCNLGLSNYSATTISRLYCGLLTGSCQNITDYVIDWYGPNNTTTLQFTSGYGNVFSNEYNLPHPLLGASAIPLNEGVYTPVIKKIILSGITFSNTGGTNNVLVDLNTCLPTTTIQPLTCSNNTNTSINWPFSAYSHFINFSNTAGVFPQSASTTYNLLSTTKFVAIAFKGYGNADRLQISFSGLSYPTTINLEDIVVGGNVTNSFNISSFPKSANTTGYFTKIICLTGLTVNNNDKIELKVTPYDDITSWDLYITCLTNYTCNNCLTTQPYKIIGSSITGLTNSCNTLINVQYQVSGCTLLYNDYSTYYIYNQQGLNYNTTTTEFVFSQNNIPIIYNWPAELYFNNLNCTVGATSISTPSCNISSTPTTYEKTFVGGKGVYTISGNSTVISNYYNTWINVSTAYAGSSNPTNISYYRRIDFNIPNFGSTNNCVDGESTTLLYLHPTSNAITGNTGSNYYFKLTANTISNNTSISNCSVNCNNNIQGMINLINSSSTGSTPTYGTDRTFTNGKYFVNPISTVVTISSGNTVTTADTNNRSYFKTFDWTSNTYPFSGTGNTLIPSLSGTVCNYNNIGVRLPLFNSYYNQNYKFYFETRLTNPLNVEDFDIWSSPITNFSYSGSPGTAFYELAYRYSGGSTTYSNPTYII